MRVQYCPRVYPCVGFHRVQRRCCGSTRDAGRARAVSASARSDSGQTYSVQEKIFTVQGLCMLCVYVVLCFAQPLARPSMHPTIHPNPHCTREGLRRGRFVFGDSAGTHRCSTHLSSPRPLMHIVFNDRVMAPPFLFGDLIPGPLGVTLCHRRNHT